MSLLAHPTADNRLRIRLIGVDDHKPELRPAIAAARRANISPVAFDTATQWARAARRANDNSILVADNRMEALDNLESVGHADIPTDGGNNAGIRLLTTFCDREHIKSGLKIILTAFNVPDRDMHAIDRRRHRTGDNILLIRKKTTAETQQYLLNIFAEYYNLCYMSFLREKFEFVGAVMDEWGLDEVERNILLGVHSLEDPVIAALRDGETSSTDAETRCDLIYRLRANLDLLFEGSLTLQAKWLRAKLPPLGNKSPIEFLSDRSQPSLAALVFKLEGP